MTTTPKTPDQLENVNRDVEANCFSRSYPNKYACNIEKLNVIEPNYRIMNIKAKHEEGKTDADVDILGIFASNLTYFPTIDDAVIVKFRKFSELLITGHQSRVVLNPQFIVKIPSNITRFSFGSFVEKFPKKLPPNFLTQARDLVEFQAYDNVMEEIPLLFPVENTKLKKFSIPNNRLKIFPKELLSNLIELSFFEANNNEISSLDEEFFTKNLKFNTIILHNNLIQFIPELIFSKNADLEMINLQHNKIYFLPEKLFAKNRNLKVINVANNQLSFLHARLLENLIHLTSFTACDNDIKEIPNGFTRNNRKDLFLSICLVPYPNRPAQSAAYQPPQYSQPTQYQPSSYNSPQYPQQQPSNQPAVYQQPQSQYY